MVARTKRQAWVAPLYLATVDALGSAKGLSRFTDAHPKNQIT
jgi:hypothetical protein